MALTIVDKDLVGLFRAMYRCEQTSGFPGGNFTTLVSEALDLLDQKDMQQMLIWKNELIYKKGPSSSNKVYSSTLRESQQALFELVENIRIITVKSTDDAITIDAQLISNIDYFMKIMKLVDEEFLIREYKITKETSLQGSLLFSKEDIDNNKNRNFFHVSDPQKQVFPAMVGTSSTSYQLQGLNEALKQSQITLARCILLSFEKCLNIHYAEYMKKLSQIQNQFFFVKDSEIINNPFQQDLKLANWWLGLNQVQKSKHLELAKDMEREIVLQYNNHKFDVVNESDDDSDYKSYTGMQQIQCEPSVTESFELQRRKKKDRKKFGERDSTSSSGIDYSVGGYNSKQMKLQYGNYSDEEDNALQNHQSQLFLSIDNSMYKCRQNLVHKALQAQDIPQCLMFIKQLSLCKTFMNVMREDNKGQIQPKTLADVKRILHKKYFDYLEEAFQKSVLADLFSDSDAEIKKKKKKNKRKKNKKIEEVKEIKLEIPKQIALQLELNSPEPELPLIQINFDRIQIDEPVLEQSSDTSSLSRQKAMDSLFNNYKTQDDELMNMARRLEKIRTCEMMLDEGLLDKEGYGSDFLNSLLHDKDDEDKQSQYEEQRTGLLSNEVLFNKYPNPVELMEDRQQKQDQQDQLKYLMSTYETGKYNKGSDAGKYSINKGSSNSYQPSSNLEFSDSDSDKEEVSKLRTQIEFLNPIKELVKEETKQKEEEIVQKKKRKNKKKSKKQKNEIKTQIIESTPPVIQTPEKIKDLEEISLQAETLHIKPPQNVRKNNFFSDDSSSVSSTNLSVTYLKDGLKEIQSKERKKTVQKKVIPQKQPQPEPIQKQSKKKKPAKSILDPPVSIFSIQSPPQIKQIQTPIILKLTDDIKIPSRGSVRSSQRDEADLEHQKTLQELDSLFSSSSGKNRSSTVEKQRSSLQVSQFNDLLDDLEDSCTVQSVKNNTKQNLEINQKAPITKKDKPKKVKEEEEKKKQVTRQQPSTSKQQKQKKEPAQPKPVQQFKPKQATPTPVATKIENPKTFESYDSMFQNIYGAGTATPTKPEQKMTSSSFNTDAKVISKQVNTILTKEITTTIQTSEGTITTSTKLNKKQMKKVERLQEHGAMATPNYFKSKDDQGQVYTDSNFQTITKTDQPKTNFNSFQQTNNPQNYNQQQQQSQQMQMSQQQYFNYIFPPQQCFYPQYQQQQMFFPPQQFLQQQKMYQITPIAFYNINYLVDQIQLDRRNAGFFDQHELVFHMTLGSQVLTVNSKMEIYLAEAEEARLKCFQLIEKVVRDTFPELSLRFDVYGSMATKLAIDTSDMDIAIYGIQREARSQALQQLHNKLSECKSVSSNLLILTASVPVVKLELNFAGLAEDLKIGALKFGKIMSIKIDLVINDIESNNKLHQTKLCAEFVKKQMNEHPFLKPLTITLKKYLGLKNLNSPFQGTMSSYGLVILVLTLLKDMNKLYPRFEFQQIHSQPHLFWLGRVFTHFFTVFGDPNLFNETIMTNQQLEFEVIPENNQNSLVIIDPVDFSNNVGKQIYNFFSNVQDQLQVTKQIILVRFKELQQKMAEKEIVENDFRALELQKMIKSPETSLLLKNKINLLSGEIQVKQTDLLDRIIMVNLADLSPIYRDDLEERERGMLQVTKQVSTMLQPLQLQKLFFHPMQLGMMQQHPESQNNMINTPYSETETAYFQAPR